MIHTYDAATLAQDHLDIVRVLAAALRGHARELGWLNLCQFHLPSFGFRDDFLRYYQDIALLQCQMLGLYRLIDKKAQVDSWGYLAYACNWYNAYFLTQNRASLIRL